MMKQRGVEKSAEKSQKTTEIGAFAVQCEKCMKWRFIPTKEEYETIRQNFIEDPWNCSKKPNVTCDDPADVEYDTTRMWVIDKPNIPKTPEGLERHLVMRNDFSKLDCYYLMPNGKKVRCPSDVEKFLEANPQYRDKFSVSSLNFASPKISEEMIPKNIEKGSSSVSRKAKKMKLEEEDS